jgi:hypothetical protein
MSTGHSEDLEKTIEQLKNPSQRIGNLTWLRHRTGSQSGRIDRMLLTGAYTTREMAERLQELYPDRPIDKLIKRVKEHIDHLGQGDARDHSSIHKDDDHVPHRLPLKEVDGRWMFDV